MLKTKKDSDIQFTVHTVFVTASCKHKPTEKEVHASPFADNDSHKAQTRTEETSK